MADTSETLGNSGAPIQLRLGDQVYLFSRLTRRVRAEYSEWHKGKVREELMAMRRQVDSKTYAAMMSAFASDCGSGVYEFGKPASAESLMGQEGQAQLIYLLLKDHQKDIGEEDVLAMLDDEDTRDALADVIFEILPGKKKATEAKGETGPAQKAG